MALAAGILEPFDRATADPAAVVRRWKETTGGKAVGWLPYYAPLELILAAGALPVGMWGGDAELVQSGAHLQSFSCSLSRAILELGLKGTYSVLDGVVFLSSCDHLQNLADIWTQTVPSPPKFDLVLPYNRRDPAARSYLDAVFSDLRNWLSSLTGNQVTEERLREAAEWYRRQRQALAAFYRLLADKPGILTAREAARVVKASLFLDPQAYLAYLQPLLAAMAAEETNADGRVPVILSGIVPDPPEILDLVEATGGVVVGDDLALGERFLHLQPLAADPWEGLLDRQLTLGPCSTLFNPAKDRGEHLRRRVAETGAAGVIILSMKFCEYEEFDYPPIKEDLEAARVPHLLLEVEQQGSPGGQVRTRLQAFMEMLQAGR